ncbi:MAG: ABC transporter permease [Candidatus Rokubacteria bacterium]|nr:ABC transporter permease [Candidatus Rokubacteria bacterium]
MRGFLGYLGGSALLACQALREALLPPYRFGLVVAQIHAMGVRSVVLSVIAGLFAGMVIALQGAHELERFGATLYLGPGVARSMVREAGPLMAALLIGGKVGAGITAELGAMRVTEQVDALRAIGANYVRFLVVPRVLAGLVVFPLLTIIANVIGVIGGLLVAMVQFRLDYMLYWNTIFDLTTFRDYFSGFGKSVVFGFLVAVAGCYQGLTFTGGSTELGHATTGTVVAIGIAVLVADYLLTQLFFLV